MKSFNKVYGFNINPDLYLYLNETGFEQTMQLTEGQILLFDGHSMIDNWRTLGVNWLIDEHDVNAGLKIPDIAGLGATSYVLSKEVKAIMEPNLGHNVEYLKCDLQGETWYALNLVGFEDALNHDLTEHNYNKRGEIKMIKPFKRLVIDKSKVENTALFRTKETGLSYITTDAENSFYSLIKENNLTGIDFHEIEAI
ncbi:MULTISPECIES: imm11 family protein [Pseudoalteromonas]|uniref:imm11 family protein n=1 Tax=Pseudoalteromonas TaxID=53246 RepID=UPI0005622FB5|nr:DUF1629 domain-containing protein [Pseudoalteromonas sp. A2]